MQVKVFARYGVQYDTTSAGWASMPYDVTVTRNEGEGFGFVVISSTNKATSTIGKLFCDIQFEYLYHTFNLLGVKI